ncbi:hypothetical protein [Mammaliicoccus sp. JADD-157]|uniref:hypothetical protein n=1 Tax=Mammaliicoccus sp. JADD-157 TaxID=3404818 RepID=UPI003BB63795
MIEPLVTNVEIWQGVVPAYQEMYVDDYHDLLNQYQLGIELIRFANTSGNEICVRGSKIDYIGNYHVETKGGIEDGDFA